MPNDENETRRAMADRVAKRYADEGQFVESGWQVMRLLVLPSNASDIQVSEMRKAFFAGAQHLFGALMSMVTGEDKAEDRRRLKLLDKELRAWHDELLREVTGGGKR